MQIPRVPWDCKIYMNGYGMGGNLCRIFFGFVSLWCWILPDFLSSFGFLPWKLVGGWKKRWGDEMMVLPRGSARHVFFPVHKIGFCLSHQRGDVLRWWLYWDFDFKFLLFLGSIFLLSFVRQIVFSVRVGYRDLSGDTFAFGKYFLTL